MNSKIMVRDFKVQQMRCEKKKDELKECTF